MNNTQNSSPLPKVAALIILTLGIAWLVHGYDASALNRINSMRAADYIAHQGHLHQHGYFFHFVTWLVLGGFYLGAVEFISYVIRLFLPKNRDS